jgi:L-alanine-DL-glutamate epimerase-like enolase superfamily enzyme
MGFKSPDVMAGEAVRFTKMGFKTVKIKVGDSLELDIERVTAVRDALGNRAAIKVDANQGYDLEAATRAAKAFERLDVSVIEQPLPREDLVGLRKLRERTQIAVMVDESLFDSRDALKIISMGAADVFNIKMMKPGGIGPSVKLAAVAEAAGMPCMLGSMPELGIGTMAGLQLVVTRSVFTYGSELIGPWMFEDDLLQGKPRTSDGQLMLPEGPGLGMDVDEEKIESYATT